MKNYQWTLKAFLNYTANPSQLETPAGIHVINIVESITMQKQTDN